MVKPGYVECTITDHCPHWSEGKECCACGAKQESLTGYDYKLIITALVLALLLLAFC